MPTTTKPAPAEVAANIMKRAREGGFTVEAHDTIVTVNKRFTPGDRAAYRDAEIGALHILGMCRQTQPGSVWGTDSGSVGGHVGLTGGYVRMNKSGIAKLLIRALNAAR